MKTWSNVAVGKFYHFDSLDYPEEKVVCIHEIFNNGMMHIARAFVLTGSRMGREVFVLLPETLVREMEPEVIHRNHMQHIFAEFDKSLHFGLL